MALAVSMPAIGATHTHAQRQSQTRVQATTHKAKYFKPEYKLGSVDCGPLHLMSIFCANGIFKSSFSIIQGLAAPNRKATTPKQEKQHIAQHARSAFPGPTAESLVDVRQGNTWQSQSHAGPHYLKTPLVPPTHSQIQNLAANTRL